MGHPALDQRLPHAHKESSMPDQNRSPDGIRRKDAGGPSPDVETNATDGRSDSRGKGARTGQGCAGDGPAKVGLTSDRRSRS